MPNASVPSDAILRGLGQLDRGEAAGMIALLENAGLLTVTIEAGRKLAGKFRADADANGLEKRLAAAQEAIEARGYSAFALRHRLWCRLRRAWDLPASLPLSHRSASMEGVELAWKTAKFLAPRYDEATLMQKLKRGFGGDRHAVPDFGRIVNAEASRLLGTLLEKGLLDRATESSLLDEIRCTFEDLPADLRDEKLREAISTGDTRVIGATLAGGSLAGLVLAVDLAGFSAYIIAAQASAFIPLVGGKTAVSLLAVLANPLIALGVLGIGGWFAASSAGSAANRAIAARLAVLLALRGSAHGRDAFARTVADFGAMNDEQLARAIWFSRRERRTLVDRRTMVLDRLAAPLPQPPGAPPPPLDRRLGGPEPSAASSRRSRTDEAAAADRADIGYTAMLTAGDVVYALWSIDPRVVEAAAFAHLTKGDGPVPLDDIVQRLGDATPAAARGISSALQGFTAEQWVRLNLAAEGHVVEMPAEHFTPGYDIVVDDQAFQIKCGESRTMLAEHFDRYPDIPVIANVELLDGIEREDWASMVFTVDGFDLDTVRSIIADSLEAAGTLGDLPLPLYAVLVGCVRRMHDIYTGRMALATLPGHLLVEAAVRGSLSWLGAKAAATAGLVLLGPAGAVILGPTGGIAALVGVSGVRRRLEETLSPRWAKRVVSSARRVHRSACTVLDRRLALHRRHHPAEPPDDPLRRWLHARRDDEWVTVAEQRVLLDETPCGTVADALELIDRTASLRILDPEFRRAQRDLLLALQDEEPVPERVQDGFHRVGRWSQGLWTAVRPGGDGRRAGGSNRDEC